MRLGRDASSLACLLAGLVGFGSAAPLHAQASQATPSATVLPATGVAVVRLEVVVTEKRSRPRAGLRREDFAVFEDGRSQAIVQFQAFTRAIPVLAPAPPQAASETAEESDDLLPARYVVLAIDDIHMEFESLTRVRKALTRFLKEDLRPEDQVALVTTSGSALSQEFSADRATSLDTLSRLSAQGRHPEWSGTPYISEYQAELIEGGDRLAIDAAVEEILSAGVIRDAGTAEEMSRQKARAIFAEAVYSSRLTLEALESLCRGLSGITGRKTLYLVSDGFLTGMAAGSGTSFDMRRIADAGTRAGVAVYALDTRGLVASAPAATASSQTRVLPATAGLVEAMRQRGDEARREAMHALAADTGGFLVENSNDLRAGLREILKDSETYYVLAYEPTNTKRDGGFRRIEVRLPGLHGVKVRTRSGYFAPDDRRLTAQQSAQDAARRNEQRRAEMRTALGSLAPLVAIPIRVSADFVSLDGAAGQVVVSGSVDVAGLPFVRRDDRRLATVDTAGIIYDEAGGVASALDAERLSIDVGEAEYVRLRRRGLPYQRRVALRPGRYQVRLAARDDATGLLGSAWRRVEVPDLSQGRLALSGLFLLKDEAASGPPASASAEPVLRSAQDQPRFGRAERLYVQLQAYNPKRDATGAIDVVCQAAVAKGGAVLATAAPEPMDGAATGPVAHVSRIGLQPFEPGDYELRITVTDRNASATATRVVPFTIE
jgi:VWFA-related protein